LLHVGRWLLTVLQLLTVQIDLEASLSDGCQSDANFAVASGAILGCQTGSLPEVPSRNAVLYLELSLAFSHVSDLLGHSLVLNYSNPKANQGKRCAWLVGRGQRLRTSRLSVPTRVRT